MPISELAMASFEASRLAHAERVFGDYAEQEYIDTLDDSIDDEWDGWVDQEACD